MTTPSKLDREVAAATPGKPPSEEAGTAPGKLARLRLGAQALSSGGRTMPGPAPPGAGPGAGGKPPSAAAPGAPGPPFVEELVGCRHDHRWLTPPPDVPRKAAAGHPAGWRLAAAAPQPAAAQGRGVKRTPSGASAGSQRDAAATTGRSRGKALTGRTPSGGSHQDDRAVARPLRELSPPPRSVGDHRRAYGALRAFARETGASVAHSPAESGGAGLAGFEPPPACQGRPPEPDPERAALRGLAQSAHAAAHEAIAALNKT